jgi:hypothetical protein
VGASPDIPTKDGWRYRAAVLERYSRQVGAGPGTNGWSRNWSRPR